MVLLIHCKFILFAKLCLAISPFLKLISQSELNLLNHSCFMIKLYPWYYLLSQASQKPYLPFQKKQNFSCLIQIIENWGIVKERLILLKLNLKIELENFFTQLNLSLQMSYLTSQDQIINTFLLYPRDRGSMGLDLRLLIIKSKSKLVHFYLLTDMNPNSFQCLIWFYMSLESILGYSLLNYYLYDNFYRCLIKSTSLAFR